MALAVSEDWLPCTREEYRAISKLPGHSTGVAGFACPVTFYVERDADQEIVAKAYDDYLPLDAPLGWCYFRKATP
jgi:hypothetical protein